MTEYQPSLLATGAPGIDAAAAFERVTLDEVCWVDVARGWLRGADAVLDDLAERVEWRCGRRWMFDRMVDDPRLSRWYHTDDDPPHPVLAQARGALRALYKVPLGGPALNYYRDGNDSVAPHRDRELRRLDDTVIAILTLGTRRPFLIRPVGGGPSRDLSPGAGDLLVMGGACQRRWEHAVPKVASAGPRISVSWRWAAAPRAAAHDR